MPRATQLCPPCSELGILRCFCHSFRGHHESVRDPVNVDLVVHAQNCNRYFDTQSGKVMNQIRATVGLIAASKSGARVCVAFFGDGGSFWALIYWRVEPLGDLLLMSGHCDDSFVFSRTQPVIARRSGASDRARGSFVSASVSSRVKLPASSLTVTIWPYCASVIP